MNEHVNRDYNITRGESEPGSGRFHSPINIVEDDYCDEIVPKLAAVGNVAVTTTSERLFLRQPLVVFGLVWCAFGQGGKSDVLWAPKFPPTKYTPPHKPVTRIADLLARHKGEASWREEIVKDDHIWADYIESPPGSKVSRRLHPDTREWWVVMDGQIRFEIEGQQPFVASKGAMVQVPMQTIYSMETVGDKPAPAV